MNGRRYRGPRVDLRATSGIPLPGGYSSGQSSKHDTQGPSPNLDAVAQPSPIAGAFFTRYDAIFWAYGQRQ